MDNKINLKTAFFWRHKILKVLTKKDDNDKLGGIIEADETFFEESQKGSRNVKGREARKRGYTSYTYTKKNKVCVLTHYLLQDVFVIILHHLFPNHQIQQVL